MRKLIVSEWITLDGVFDTTKFDVWFLPYMSESRNAHIREMTQNSGAKLYGRKTYEELAAYWAPLKNNEMDIADKLNSMPKYVVSNTLQNASWHNTQVIQGNIVAAIQKLKEEAGAYILLDGSASLVEFLLPTGLIDELVLLIHPIITGSGKRFFSDTMPLTAFELLESKPLEKGVMLQRYAVKRT